MLLFSLSTILLISGLILVLRRVDWHSTHSVDHRHRLPEHTATNSVYRTRAKVMNQSETAFFAELCRQLPPTYFIFAKMRIADVIETTRGQRRRSIVNAILSKHLDFVITNHELRPLVAIELNGASHARPDRIQSDAKKRAVCSEANLPLVVVPVGSVFADEVGRIRNVYSLT